MNSNRIEEHFRDPTLEWPTTDYFEVRLAHGCFKVTREGAAGIVAAMRAASRPEILRIETVTGSVVHVRTDRIEYVRESTRTQRAAEDRLWKRLGEESDEDEQDEDILGS